MKDCGHANGPSICHVVSSFVHGGTAFKLTLVPDGSLKIPTASVFGLPLGRVGRIRLRTAPVVLFGTDDVRRSLARKPPWLVSALAVALNAPKAMRRGRTKVCRTRSRLNMGVLRSFCARARP